MPSATANFAITTAMLRQGNNSVTAQYQGDSNYYNSALSQPITLVAAKVNLTRPTTPSAPVLAQVFKSGASIPVHATIYGDYRNLRIEWAPGMNATSGWSSSNVSLNEDIPSPVIEAQVGTWTTTGITSAGYYTIRLSVDDGGVSSAATGLVYLEPDLSSFSWPRRVDGATSWSSGLVPALKADGTVRLALSTYTQAFAPPRLRVFPADGTEEADVDLSWNTWYQPAAADLDLTPGDEIVVPNGRSLLFLRPDGDSYSFTPTVPGNASPFAYTQVVLDDVDGDSLLETIALANGYTADGTDVGYVFAVRNNGQLLNTGFPIEIKDESPELRSFSTNRVLVGDVDGDGAKEFVVMEGTAFSTFTPRLFGADGSPRTWLASSFGGHPTQTLLADLDHNGKLETVFLTYDQYLHVLQPDGSERPGWPQRLRYSGDGALAVGDLNRDGHEEIVASIVDVYVFNADGTPFSSAWPKLCNDGAYRNTVIADVNGDDYPEIVTSFNQLRRDPAYPVYETSQLVVFDGNGSTLRSWNLMGANAEPPEGSLYSTVGDFDGDGLTEIAVSYNTAPLTTGSLTQGVVTMYATGAAHNPKRNDWPMLNRNSRNTAVLRRLSESAVSLTSSANPSAPAQMVTFTIGVSPVSGGADTPTGRVNLINDGANVGWCTLSSGTCSVSHVPGCGSHRIVAGYVGNAEFADGISSALNQIALACNSAINLSSSSPQTVVAGGTATYTITATPTPPPYDLAITFRCSGLPSGASCTFAPASVTPGNAPATVNLSIGTAGRYAAMTKPSGLLSAGMGTIGCGLVAIVLCGMRRRKWNVVLGVAFILCCGAMSSCGGGSGSNGGGGAPPSGGTPAGAYSIEVTATGNGTSYTTVVSLNVR